MDLKVPEEILLDANEEAKAHSFYMLGSLEVSPDQTKIAYECDITGKHPTKAFVLAARCAAGCSEAAYLVESVWQFLKL